MSLDAISRANFGFYRHKNETDDDLRSRIMMAIDRRDPGMVALGKMAKEALQGKDGGKAMTEDVVI